jgi:hypothetical protein
LEDSHVLESTCHDAADAMLGFIPASGSEANKPPTPTPGSVVSKLEEMEGVANTLLCLALLTKYIIDRYVAIKKS